MLHNRFGPACEPGGTAFLRRCWPDSQPHALHRLQRAAGRAHPDGGCGRLRTRPAEGVARHGRARRAVVVQAQRSHATAGAVTPSRPALPRSLCGGPRNDPGPRRHRAPGRSRKPPAPGLCGHSPYPSDGRGECHGGQVVPLALTASMPRPPCPAFAWGFVRVGPGHRCRPPTHRAAAISPCPTESFLPEAHRGVTSRGPPPPRAPSPTARCRPPEPTGRAVRTRAAPCPPTSPAPPARRCPARGGYWRVRASPPA